MILIMNYMINNIIIMKIIDAIKMKKVKRIQRNPQMMYKIIKKFIKNLIL